MPSRCWIPMAKAASTRTSECAYEHLGISPEGCHAHLPSPHPSLQALGCLPQGPKSLRVTEGKTSLAHTGLGTQ